MNSRNKNATKEEPKSSQIQADILAATKLYRQLHAEHEKSVLALGEFLHHKLSSYPDFIEEIVVNNADVSRRMLILALHAFEGDVYAPLVFYNCVGSIRLATLPLDLQKKYWSEGIVTVTRTKNGFVETRINVCDISMPQAAIIFGQRCVRPLREQIEVAKQLQIRKSKHGHRLLSKDEIMALAETMFTVNDVLELLDRVRNQKKAKMAA